MLWRTRGLIARSIHSTRTVRGQKPYDWYVNQLRKDEDAAKYRKWLETQPLLPPLKEGHVRAKCFFDFSSIQERKDPETEEITRIKTPLGRVVYELASDYLPITCTNFTELCLGKKASYDLNQTVGYKGSKIETVLGDKYVTGGNTSIPVFPFEDEGYIIRQREGILGMMNGGVHTNRSDFYILVKDSPHMQGRYVAFGAVVEGLDIVRKITHGLAFRGQLLNKVIISDCGVLESSE